MTSPKKNLLEAFRSAGAAPETSTPAPRVEPRSPVASSPAATGTGTSRGLPQPPRWLFPVVGLALAFAFGFLTGRMGNDDGVKAEQGAAPESAREEARDPRNSIGNSGTRSALEGERRAALEERPPTTAPAATPPARLEDSSLFDPRNTHTIIVATYDHQAKDLALATYDHLVDARLPVFPPVLSGKHLVVLVGAADSYAALENDEVAVRALVRAGERPYSGAYRVRIDSILSRK